MHLHSIEIVGATALSHSRLTLAYVVAGWTHAFVLRRVWLLLIVALLSLVVLAFTREPSAFWLVLFYAAGAVVGALASLLSRLPLVSPRDESEVGAWPSHLISLAAQWLTFWAVDDRVSENGFPLGLLRTYALWLGVVVLAFYWHRPSVKRLRVTKREYDDSYTLFVLSTTWLFLVYVWLWASTWWIAALALSTLAFAYAVVWAVVWERVRERRE